MVLWAISHAGKSNELCRSLYDREHDRIHVVERVEGQRVYKEYPAEYVSCTLMIPEANLPASMVLQ
jgi:hypothetical protein